MNIDERLEFLRQSTESLHASCQELHATVAQQAEESKRQAEQMAALGARERTARQAILQGIAAYLRALDGQDQDDKKL